MADQPAAQRRSPRLKRGSESDESPARPAPKPKTPRKAKTPAKTREEPTAEPVAEETETEKPKASKKKGKGKASTNKKRKKKGVKTYGSYIHHVMKGVHPDTSMTKKSVAVLNSFVMDLMERVTQDAIRLTRNARRKTLSSREIAFAVANVLGHQSLAKLADKHGKAAVTAYEQSMK